MADLEELAVKRDRKYLMRLVVFLLLGIAASVFIFQGLTGERVSSCAADAMLGADKNADDTNADDKSSK